MYSNNSDTSPTREFEIDRPFVLAAHTQRVGFPPASDNDRIESLYDRGPHRLTNSAADRRLASRPMAGGPQDGESAGRARWDSLGVT